MSMGAGDVGKVHLGVQLEVDQAQARAAIQKGINNAIRGKGIVLENFHISGLDEKGLGDKIKSSIQKELEDAGADVDILLGADQIHISTAEVTQKLERDLRKSLRKAPQLEIGTANALKQAENVKARVSGIFKAIEDEARVPRLHVFEQNLNKSLARIGLNVRTFSALLGAGITGSLVVAGLRLLGGAIAEVTKTALEMHEAVASSNAVFGEASQSVQDYADKSRAALFLTKQEAIEAATEIGLVFRMSGASEAGAASIAMALETAVTNLTALQGSTTGVSKGLTALREALKGDAQDLIRLGVVYNDFDIKNEAVRLGLIKTGESLTANNTALVTAKLFLNDTSRVTGEAAKRAEDAAGGFRRFLREVEDLKLALGDLTLGPIAEGAHNLAVVFSGLADAFNAAREAYSKLPWVKGDEGKQEKVTAAIKAEEKARRDANKAIDETIARRGIAEQKLQRLQSNPNIVLDVVAAQQRLKGATLSVERAQLSAEQAQHSLNVARHTGTIGDKEYTRAELALESAQLRVQSAQLGVQKADLDHERTQRNLIRLREDLADLPLLHEFQDIQNAIDLEQAERALTKQLKDQLATVRELARAHEDIEDAYHRLARVSKSAAAGQRDIRDANRGILDAQARLEELKFQQSGEGLDRRGAELQLRQAKLSSERLDNKQLREEQDLRDQITDTNFRLIETDIAMKNSRIELAQANIGLKDAQVQVQVSALELRAAELAVREAGLAVIGAMHEQALATADLDASQKLLRGEFQSVAERTQIFTDTLAGLSSSIADGPIKTELGSLAGEVSANAAAYQAAVKGTQDYIKAQDDLERALKKRRDKQKKSAEEDDRNLLEKVADVLIAAGRMINPLSFLIPGPPERHAGGAVMRGRPYLTRENELFVPSSHGKIHSPESTKAMTMGNPVNVNLNVSKVVDTDENVLARQLARHINRRIPSV